MMRKLANALNYEQAAALLEALDSPAREMAATAMLTSMNVAEICGLLWKNLNLTPKWLISKNGDGLRVAEAMGRRVASGAGIVIM